MSLYGPGQSDTCDVTIIVPFYNPGPRFGSHLARVVDVLEASGSTFEIIAVSDGSTEASQQVVGKFEAHGVRLITMANNGGKGSALRAGMADARGRYVGFIDADGDIPASTIPRFLELTRSDDAPDIILGSKRHPDSEVVYPLLRHAYSWCYQLLIGILFHLPVRDTQTGIKFVRRDVLSAVVPRMLEKRFAFDLELLVVARHLGYRHVVEAPVEIGERFTSTVSIHAVQGIVLDTLAIFYRLHLLKYYDRPHQAAIAPVAARTPPPPANQPTGPGPQESTLDVPS
ncbi:MAG TPA: glycosyltransferase [Acidimicrobiales bacterium]|jgi:glycosyltransferase involved in cell wall biosynthesis|nr:glycosyltransferase [Acidimicrobiales bacterium]